MHQIRTEEQKKYRNELKYFVSPTQIAGIQNRIKNLLPLDTYVKEEGYYQIRSLYFDDRDNRCYYENEDGVDPREKFRIRIYNHNTERITLECKRKEKGMTQKTSCALTEMQCRQLMAGNYLTDIENQPPLLRKLTLEMMMHGMHPVVIVEYKRIPYVYKNGNVRITFDLDVSSSARVGDFLEKTISERPVFPLGQQILEVKYDEYIPNFIYQNLQVGQLQQTTCSKYYLCRKSTV